MAVLQPDGNFVVYGADGTVRWFSGTRGHGNAVLSLENDGNLAIYRLDGTLIWDRHRGPLQRGR